MAIRRVHDPNIEQDLAFETQSWHVERIGTWVFKAAQRLGDDRLEELGERMMAEVEAVKGPPTSRRAA